MGAVRLKKSPAQTAKNAHAKNLIESIKIVLQEALEFNRQEALDAASEGFELKSHCLVEAHRHILFKLLRAQRLRYCSEKALTIRGGTTN